ncbi:MAG: hypothetical protein PsegKO_15550 [Pseudohongiellaceae bacterium]
MELLVALILARPLVSCGRAGQEEFAGFISLRSELRRGSEAGEYRDVPAITALADRGSQDCRKA